MKHVGVYKDIWVL